MSITGIRAYRNGEGFLTIVADTEDGWHPHVDVLTVTPETILTGLSTLSRRAFEGEAYYPGGRFCEGVR